MSVSSATGNEDVLGPLLLSSTWSSTASLSTKVLTMLGSPDIEVGANVVKLGERGKNSAPMLADGAWADSWATRNIVAS